MVYADGADTAQAAEIFEAISGTVSRHDLSLKERLLAFGDILEKKRERAAVASARLASQ
jgi:hypothetical protein